MKIQLKQSLLPLCGALLIATSWMHAGEPVPLSYNQPVTLTGTIVREWDMTFVDSDLGPMQDAKAVARAVAEARRRETDPSKSHEAFPHLILRLDHAVSVLPKSGDSLNEAEHKVTEIDLSAIQRGQPEKEWGKTRYTVSGSLSHAMTVHHLRPVTMKVTDLKHAK
jgi:hypothetical protein